MHVNTLNTVEFYLHALADANELCPKKGHSSSIGIVKSYFTRNMQFSRSLVHKKNFEKNDLTKNLEIRILISFKGGRIFLLSENEIGEKLCVTIILRDFVSNP